MRRFLIAIMLLLGPLAPVHAQPGIGVPPVAVAPQDKLVDVRLDTSEGTIVLALDLGGAPITSANFLRYVDQKRLDGTTFYRALKVSGDTPLGFIQGGTRNDPKRVLSPIAHEPTNVTGITHQAGTISMARYEPGSANGDFFITVGPMPSMDAQPSGEGDIAGFAAFGRVIEGMDVVQKILADPTSATEGEGVMKGQMLSPAVIILSARRVPPSR